MLIDGSEIEDPNFFYDPNSLNIYLTVSDPSLYTSQDRKQYRTYLHITRWNGNIFSNLWDSFEVIYVDPVVECPSSLVESVADGSIYTLFFG